MDSFGSPAKNYRSKYGRAFYKPGKPCHVNYYQNNRLSDVTTNQAQQQHPLANIPSFNGSPTFLTGGGGPWNQTLIAFSPIQPAHGSPALTPLGEQELRGGATISTPQGYFLLSSPSLTPTPPNAYHLPTALCATPPFPSVQVVTPQPIQNMVVVENPLSADMSDNTAYIPVLQNGVLTMIPASPFLFSGSTNQQPQIGGGEPVGAVNSQYETCVPADNKYHDHPDINDIMAQLSSLQPHPPTTLDSFSQQFQNNKVRYPGDGLSEERYTGFVRDIAGTLPMFQTPADSSYGRAIPSNNSFITPTYPPNPLYSQVNAYSPFPPFRGNFPSDSGFKPYINNQRFQQGGGGYSSSSNSYQHHANRFPYLSSIGPTKTQMSSGWIAPSEELQRIIVARIESMFEDEYLFHDTFMLKHVLRNKEGYVNLKLLSALRKIKRITPDWRDVAYSITKLSTNLVLNYPDNTKVKRKTMPRLCHVKFANTRLIICFNVPNDPELILILLRDVESAGQEALASSEDKQNAMLKHKPIIKSSSGSTTFASNIKEAVGENVPHQNSIINLQKRTTPLIWHKIFKSGSNIPNDTFNFLHQFHCDNIPNFLAVEYPTIIEADRAVSLLNYKYGVELSNIGNSSGNSLSFLTIPQVLSYNLKLENPVMSGNGGNSKAGKRTSHAMAQDTSTPCYNTLNVDVDNLNILSPNFATNLASPTAFKDESGLEHSKESKLERSAGQHDSGFINMSSEMDSYHTESYESSHPSSSSEALGLSNQHLFSQDPQVTFINKLLYHESSPYISSMNQNFGLRGIYPNKVTSSGNKQHNCSLLHTSKVEQDMGSPQTQIAPGSSSKNPLNATNAFLPDKILSTQALENFFRNRAHTVNVASLIRASKNNRKNTPVDPNFLSKAPNCNTNFKQPMKIGAFYQAGQDGTNKTSTAKTKPNFGSPFGTYDNRNRLSLNEGRPHMARLMTQRTSDPTHENSARYALDCDQHPMTAELRKNNSANELIYSLKTFLDNTLKLGGNTNRTIQHPNFTSNDSKTSWKIGNSIHSSSVNTTRENRFSSGHFNSGSKLKRQPPIDPGRLNNNNTNSRCNTYQNDINDQIMSKWFGDIGISKNTGAQRSRLFRGSSPELRQKPVNTADQIKFSNDDEILNIYKNLFK